MKLEEREKERQIEEREKDRQMQIKMRELDLASDRHDSTSQANSKFNILGNIKLVPPFSEKVVDKYFIMFEKVAENSRWPRGDWTQILQSVLQGKARNIYISL